MKSLLKLLLLICIAAAINGCKKGGYGNYPGGVPYDVVALLDVRTIYHGEDVTLTRDLMFGGSKIGVVVISDHAEGNLPPGLLVVQDSRRLDLLRGISIELGPAAANYKPGDSLLIDVLGGVLTRKDGILMITGLSESNIAKKGRGVINVNTVNIAQLLAKPEDYESTLCILNKSSFNPAPQPGDVISGTKVINDGFANVTLYTDPGVSYANMAPYGLGAYVVIPFGKPDGSLEVRTRNADDMLNMGSSAQDILITGIMADPKGGDGGQEYVQLMATKDIDFSVTPYSIVVCNNAGASTPALDAGWATGGQRTIKWNITSGVVPKGKFFYFGFQGRKINGNAGTPFPPDAIFIQKTYSTSSGSTNAGDGGLVRPSNFGTSGPFANSGNASGVAIFKGTTVTEQSVPVDVLFIASGGGASIYDPSLNPPRGYRICNNDWYSMYSVVINPETYRPETIPYLYYRSPGNTTFMPYATNERHPTAATDASLFNMMGGVYNVTLGRWTTARKQTVVELFQVETDGFPPATIDDIEKHPNVTRLEE